MISIVGLLDATECQNQVRRLAALRSLWCDRTSRGDGTFFTLGRAAYLDICETSDASRYYNDIADSNKLLLSHFGMLYLDLLNVLTSLLGSSVRLSDEFAYPGFHIFRGKGIAGAGNSGRHFDIQYSKLRLPDGIMTSEPVSFTLSLKLPRGGSGLEMWNFTAEDFERAYISGRASSVDEYADRRSRSYHAYAVGQLFVHRGLWLHRLCSPGVILPDDERITLQGHALRTDRGWLAYW